MNLHRQVDNHNQTGNNLPEVRRVRVQVVGGLLLALGFSVVLNNLGLGFLPQLSGLITPPGAGIPGLGGAMLEIPPALMVFAVVFSLLAGVQSGIYPAMRAAGMQPLEALRHE